jgi:hypothetical protein
MKDLGSDTSSRKYCAPASQPAWIPLLSQASEIQYAITKSTSTSFSGVWRVSEIHSESKETKTRVLDQHRLYLIEIPHNLVCGLDPCITGHVNRLAFVAEPKSSKGYKSRLSAVGHGQGTIGRRTLNVPSACKNCSSSEI